MFFDMKRPKPVPRKDFEANFVNNFGKAYSSIPIPLSLIIIITI
jgi:hypothetical protein